MPSFEEVAERVWVARYPWCDVNVTAIGSTRGLLVVDTHSSERAAREVIDDVRRLAAGPVVGIVNTHEHFDHVFGNAAFVDAFGELPIHAHEEAAARTVESGERVKREYAAQPDDPHAEEIAETRILPAGVTFSSALVLDLGDRAVELLHPGQGHTGGDIVIRIPDADVLLGGDLIEESSPPYYGGDSWPLEWPRSLDFVLQLLTDSTVVVPGHGSVVDREFVHDQRSDIGIVAETIRDLAGRGVPLDHALDAAEWPFPKQGLTDAVRRGYEQLPRSARSLPLL